MLFLTKNKLAIFQKKRNIDILITTLLYYYKDTRLSHYHRLIGGGGGQRVTDSVKSSWAGKGVEIQMLTLKNWEIIHHSKMKTFFFAHIFLCIKHFNCTKWKKMSCVSFYLLKNKHTHTHIYNERYNNTALVVMYVYRLFL